jgi:hypothetical protein
VESAARRGRERRLALPLGALGELRTDAGTNVLLAKFSWRFGE